MEFAVGYQLGGEDEEPFAAVVAEFAEHVAEVYYAPPGAASARAPLPDDAASCRRFECDLRAIRELGIGLNLLLNANCYGGLAMSRQLERRVVGYVRQLQQLAGSAAAVTTTSPAVAAVVKRHFPGVPVLASVSMRIGTVLGMEHLAELFDGYCVQRDHNRDMEHLRRLRRWADDHGKRLTLLANSGCLRFCPGQTFHDNLVSHEAEVAAADNIEGFVPYVCWNLLRDRARWPAVLQATWIRPEDLHHYEGLFAVVKLATRLHDRPWVVLRAYTQRRYEGNLLDLLEPGFGPAFAPWAVDNTRFPADWFARTSTCGGRCEDCLYCAEVLERVLVDLGEPGNSLLTPNTGRVR